MSILIPYDRLDDDALWQGMSDRVHTVLGSVGILKMMGGRSEDDARRQWVSSVRAQLDVLDAHVDLRYAGEALFDAGDGVGLQYDIHTVDVLVDGHGRVRTMRLMAPAAVALALVGQRRWGERWISRLREFGSTRPIVHASEVLHADRFPWVAQNPGRPGPWTQAATEDDARTAAIAEDLGVDAVAALFEKVGGETDE